MRAPKRYNGSPLGLNQHEERVTWCSVMQKRKEYLFYISDSRASEPTHASAVGGAVTHTNKMRLNTIVLTYSLKKEKKCLTSRATGHQHPT